MSSEKWSMVTIDSVKAAKRYASTGGPFGSKLGGKDYVDEGVPVIRGANLPLDSRFSADDFVFVSEEKADELIANIANPGDVVFTQRGTLGQVGIIPKDCGHKRFVISQSQMKLTVDKEQCDARFIYYYFRNEETVKTIKGLAISSGVPHINLTILRNFKVPKPPLSTQRKIAAILSAYDDLIENNTRRIAVLEEMAQNLYREWFVHFRFPGHEQVKMVDSPLGKIPEGWEAKSLAELIKIKHGYAFKSKYFSDSGDFVVLTPGNFHENGGMKYKGSKEKYYTDSPPEDFVLYRGDLLIAMTDLTQNAPILGSPLFVPETGRFLHNQRLGKVSIIRPELISYEFMFWLFNSCNVRGQIKGSATGSTVRHTSPSRIYEVAAVLPPTEIMHRFTLLAKECFSLSEIWTKQLQNLRTTRDLLLPKLISGQLNVEDLDIDVGEPVEELEAAL